MALSFLDCIVDVSDNNVITDYAAVAKSGILLAFVKAMDGAGPTYRTYAAQSAGFRTAGIAVVPYLFLEPMDNVTNFIRETQLAMYDPFALDWEGRANQTATPSNAQAIGQRLQAVANRLPVGYWGIQGSTPAQPTKIMQGWDRWVPRYPMSPQPTEFARLSLAARAKCPSGALFWQYTSAGAVPGITGSVDRSVWLGTMDQLAQWIKDGTRPT